MANPKTQIRTNAITSSFGQTLGQVNDSLTNKAPLADISVVDLSGSLSFLASAIRRIHGGAAFSNQTAGDFSQDIALKTGGAAALRIGDGSAGDMKLYFDGSGNDFYMGVDDTDDKLHIGLGQAVGTTSNIVLEHATRDVVFKGDVTVEGGKVTLSNGAIVDSETAGKIKLTEDLVECSADLTVLGNDLDFAAGNVNLGASIGANTLKLGAATTLVETLGDLQVSGNDIKDSGANNQISFTAGSKATFGYDLDHADTDWSIGLSMTTANKEIVMGKGAQLVASGNIKMVGTDFKDSAGVALKFVAGTSIEVAGGRKLIGGTAANLFISGGDGRKLSLQGSSALTFEDQFVKLNATLSDGIPLSSSGTECTSFVSNFGDVSLLNAINQAATGAPAGVDKYTAKIAAPITNGQVGSGGFDSAPNVSDLTTPEYAKRIDIYLNGQLMTSGSTEDYVLTTVGATTGVDFGFGLVPDDVVIFNVR